MGNRADLFRDILEEQEHNQELFQAMKEQLQRCQAALRFYADSDNYKDSTGTIWDNLEGPNVVWDGGRRARTALYGKDE